MRILKISVAMIATTLFTLPALAQDAEGIRAGGFIIQPSITLALGFDSNIFTEDTGEDSSFVSTVEPRVVVQSDWNRHELRLDAGTSYRFLSESSDDGALQGDIGLSGVLDVTRAVGINASLGYQHRSEPRGEDDTGLAISGPVKSNNYSAALGADAVFGRFRVSPFGNVELNDFNDVTLTLGGIDNQDDRDRIAYGGGVELGYSVRRGIEAFVSGQYGVVDFDAAVDDTGVNRDSDGWRVLAGAKVDLTRLIEASAGVGVESRNFQDPTLSSVTDFSADVGVTWFITPLTTLDLGAQRSFKETTIAGASVVTSTQVQFGVTHDLLRNLSLNSTLTYSRENFEGSGRKDNLFGIGVGADWQVTRLFSVGPSYQFRLGDSNAAGQDYVDHQFFVTSVFGFK